MCLMAHIHKEHARLFQLPVRVYHIWDCLPEQFVWMYLQVAVLCQQPCQYSQLKLGDSLVLLAEGLLTKPLACLCSPVDCQYYSYFLCVQFLITPVSTLADILQAGSGPVTGCKEHCLANWSAILISSIPMCLGTHVL